MTVLRKISVFLHKNLATPHLYSFDEIFVLSGHHICVDREIFINA